MLSTAARANLTVVLVGARNPSNIGAAARAMQDFGFSGLRIVNDFAAPFEAAQLENPLEIPKSAVAAASVIHTAQRFNTLPEAIADCSFVIGTTAIGDRELRQPIEPLQQTTPRVLQHLTTTRVALLFGSEKTGLTRDHLSHCHLLTTIPMFAPTGERHLSMNLGQSVAVCLYELTREGLEDAKEIPTHTETPATSADRERLTQQLLDVMQATGYTRRFPANSAEPTVRQLTRQLGTTHREATTWMGILRQILYRENPEPENPKPENPDQKK